MKIAVNFSEALLDLLNQEPELPIDYIKVPTMSLPASLIQFEKGILHRKLLPHLAQPGVLSLNHLDPGQRFNQELIAKIICHTNPPYLSTHLDAKAEYFPEMLQYQHTLHSFVKTEVSLRTLETLKLIKSELLLPIVLENFPYYAWGIHYRIVSEPEFISWICYTSDCDFLLDIAHARCSAWHLRIKPVDYLKQLPLNRLREIHLAGTWLRPEGLIDAHTVLEEEDYQLLSLVLEQCEPEIITLEYGGMANEIVDHNGKRYPVNRNNPDELRTMIYRMAQLIQ